MRRSYVASHRESQKQLARPASASNAHAPANHYVFLRSICEPRVARNLKSPLFSAKANHPSATYTRLSETDRCLWPKNAQVLSSHLQVPQHPIIHSPRIHISPCCLLLSASTLSLSLSRLFITITALNIVVCMRDQFLGERENHSLCMYVCIFDWRTSEENLRLLTTWIDSSFAPGGGGSMYGWSVRRSRGHWVWSVDSAWVESPCPLPNHMGIQDRGFEIRQT